MENKIELHNAFVYDCDACGRENFVRSVLVEWDKETMQGMREELGVEPWEEGEWCTAPRSVECQHCGATFDTALADD